MLISGNEVILPPSLKLPLLLSGVVVCFYVRTHFSLTCVCVFVSQKKKVSYIVSLIHQEKKSYSAKKTLLMFSI